MEPVVDGCLSSSSHGSNASLTLRARSVSPCLSPEVPGSIPIAAGIPPVFLYMWLSGYTDRAHGSRGSHFDKVAFHLCSLLVARTTRDTLVPLPSISDRELTSSFLNIRKSFIKNNTGTKSTVLVQVMLDTHGIES